MDDVALTQGRRGGQAADRSGAGVNLLRTFRMVILSAATVSLGGFGVSEENPLLGLVLVLASGAGWVVTEFWARGVPRWATNLMLVGLLIGACVRVMQGGAPVSAFNGFLASLLVLKMWERREVRDYGQVLTMSLFLAIGGTLNRSTLGVGVTLIILAPLLVAGTMMFQILAPWSRFGKDALAADARRNRRPLPSLAPIGLFSAAVGIAIACVVFVSVPRGIGLSQFGRFGSAGSGRMIGFADRVQLGQGGLLSESQEVVLSVRLSDADHQPLGGQGQVQYLRGAVLEDYEDGRWTAARKVPRGQRSDEARERGQELFISQNPPSSPTIFQNYRVRNAGSRSFPLFTLLMPRSLATTRAGRLRVDRATGIVLREGEAGPLEYTVISAPDAPPDEGEERDRLPETLGQPRFAGLAASLLGPSGISPDPARRPVADDASAARVFESHLRNTFTYTRDVLACPPGRDPTEWFLFDARTGHCEYFASALTALCREVGIDARVVTGYAAGEFDPVTFEYTVRSSAAHAWVEVKVGPSQWRTMDGTPPASMPAGAAASQTWWARMMRSFESVQDVWADSIVSFDSAQQSRLFGGNAFESPPGTAWMERFAQRGFRVRGFESPTLPVIGAATASLIIVAAGFLWTRRALARRRASREAGFGDLTPLHAQLLARFRSMGRPKPTHRSALKHARDSVNTPGGQGALVAAELLFEARFSGISLSPADRQRAVAALRRR